VICNLELKAIIKPAVFMLWLLVGAMVTCMVAEAQNVLVTPEDCRDEGWFDHGLVRGVDPQQNKLILNYATSPSTTGIQRQTAAEIEKAITHGITYYRDTLKLLPPPRLLCVADPNAGGEYKYVFGMDSQMVNDAWGIFHEDSSGPFPTPNIALAPGVITAFSGLANGGPGDDGPIMTPIHEFFHSVAVAYPLFKVCGRGCTAGWTDEGIADAFAYAWLRKYDMVELNNRITLNRSLRYIDHPLHQPGSSHPDGGDTEYATSLFWSYLAWEPKYVDKSKNRKHPGGSLFGLRPKGTGFKPELILKFLEMDPASVGKYSSISNRHGPWQLEWLDKALRDALVKARNSLSIKIPRDPKGGLYIIYPKFAAWLVAHLTTNLHSSALDGILDRLFNTGCVEVTLNAEAGSPQTESFQVFEMATSCLRVTRTGKYKNATVDVTMMSPRDQFDQIHLGWNGEVITPHKKMSKSKKWTVGAPLGSGSTNPTGADLVIAISNVPEDISSITSKPDGELTDVTVMELMIKYTNAGGTN